MKPHQTVEKSSEKLLPLRGKKERNVEPMEQPILDTNAGKQLS